MVPLIPLFQSERQLSFFVPHRAELRKSLAPVKVRGKALRVPTSVCAGGLSLAPRRQIAITLLCFLLRNLREVGDRRVLCET